MNGRTAAIAAISMAAFAAGAHAQEPATGSGPATQMAAQCQGKIAPAVAGLGIAACAGFLDGVMSTHRMMVDFYGARPAFCTPERGIAMQRAVEVFVGYLATHPDHADTSARQAALFALADAYPCTSPASR